MACRNLHLRQIANRRPVATRAAWPRRHGSFLVEVVVAAALFSTAVFALGRLAQQTASLSIHADEQLAAQLTGENTLARLQAADYDQVPALAKQLETTDTDAPFTIQIDTNTVKIANAPATELSIAITSQAKTTGRDQSLILHDWRFEESENDDE